MGQHVSISCGVRCVVRLVHKCILIDISASGKAFINLSLLCSVMSACYDFHQLGLQGCIGPFYSPLRLWMVHTPKPLLNPQHFQSNFVRLCYEMWSIVTTYAVRNTELTKTSSHKHFATDLASGPTVGVASIHLLKRQITIKIYFTLPIL